MARNSAHTPYCYSFTKIYSITTIAPLSLLEIHIPFSLIKLKLQPIFVKILLLFIQNERDIRVVHICLSDFGSLKSTQICLKV